MKILIAYASNNDTTQMCAELLGEKLPGADIVNLRRTKPAIDDYDTVIIGSCIRFNDVHNAAKDFIGDNLDKLMKVNTAIFLCCGFPEKINQYLLHNIPKKLLDKSVSIQCFGGRLKVKPYKLVDQLVMKIVKKNFKVSKREFTSIDNESISKMAEDILKLK
nr:flavodoxin domain-containing protein [Sedimentibacter sp.]